jgi:hypothetical protein
MSNNWLADKMTYLCVCDMFCHMLALDRSVCGYLDALSHQLLIYACSFTLVKSDMIFTEDLHFVLQRLCQARRLLDQLRSCIVASYYGRVMSSNQASDEIGNRAS